MGLGQPARDRVLRGEPIVVGGVFVWRCTWHRSPIIDLSLLRIRTFSAANAATIIAAAGFYGYTLCNVCS